MHDKFVKAYAQNLHLPKNYKWRMRIQDNRTFDTLELHGENNLEDLVKILSEELRRQKDGLK